MDVLNKTTQFKHYHDVYFSGHLHDGFIYKSKPAKFDDTDQLFLATPATGKINLNKPVAYLITLNYNDKGDDILSMDISILNCNSNYNITESNYLTWYFNGNNDVNKKITVTKPADNHNKWNKYWTGYNINSNNNFKRLITN